MSDDAKKEEGQEGGKKRGSFLMPIIVVLVGCVSAALGFCLPMVLGPAKHEPAHEEKVAEEESTDYVDFDEAVVNLDDGRLNRYLRINVTLCVEKSDKEKIDKLVQGHKKMLKSWLIAYLSDKDMEAVRGAAGQNRVRRDILDYFNETLFEDDTHKIKDVYFTEFNIQ